MVKKALVLLGLSLSLMATEALQQKVGSLMDARTYQVNKRFIELLFRDQESFYQEGRIDFAKVALKLKENGLLKLAFGAPQDLRLSLVTSSSPLLFTKAITSSLHSLGYYYFAPKEAEYSEGIYRLGIEMNTEHAIDPVLFIAELRKHGYRVADVVRHEATRWEYWLELERATILEAERLELDRALEVSRPSGEYWLEVENLAGTLHFSALSWGAKIYPQVALFDASLRLISMHSLERGSTGFSVNIPHGVHFVRLSDSHSPANIKGGIRFQLIP